MHQRIKVLIFIVLSNISSFSFAQDNYFAGEGSDTFMGVGPRYMALGGAGVAISDDIYSIFSNSANLSKIDEVQVSISKQINSELIPINFLGAAFPVPFLEKSGYSTVIALAYIPRLHFRADGSFTEDDFESIFLRYALPHLPGDFTGEVESKTKDYRFAAAFSPSDSDRWAAGFSIGRVDCATFSCGSSATSTDGYQFVTTKATAININLGFNYKFSEKYSFGLSVKDIHTRLDVHVETTDDSGTELQVLETGFPTDITFGILSHYSETLDWTADFQSMSGRFGDYRIEVQTIKLGAEKHYNNFTARFGLLIPIKIHSPQIKDIDLPFFMAPTVGIGWNFHGVKIDLAAYAHPIMSYNRDSIYLSTDLSFSYDF